MGAHPLPCHSLRGMDASQGVGLDGPRLTAAHGSLCHVCVAFLLLVGPYDQAFSGLQHPLDILDHNSSRGNPPTLLVGRIPAIPQSCLFAHRQVSPCCTGPAHLSASSCAEQLDPPMSCLSSPSVPVFLRGGSLEHGGKQFFTVLPFPSVHALSHLWLNAVPSC